MAHGNARLLMRIGIVTQSYYPVFGGVSEHVQGLAVALLRRGHEVTILTGDAGASAASEEARLRQAGGEVVRVGHVYRVRCNGATVAIVGEPGLAAGLHRLSRHAFDVVHVHSPLEPLLPMAAALWFDAPIVGTFHSAGRSVRAYRLLAPLLRPILARVRIRTAVSASARDFVAEVFPGSYRLVPNGVELDRFRRAQGQVRAGERMQDREAKLLMVGRLDPRKGHEVVLQALQRLLATGRGALPRVLLEIAGDGPLRKRLSKQAERLPVRFHGALSAAEIAGLYRQADLVLAPAQYGESFGVVLLEAMAAGCPLIASDIPGYRDVLSRSDAGILVARDDPATWSLAIQDLLRQPERMRSMAEAGAVCVPRFSWDRLAGDMERIYAEAAGITRAILRADPPLADLPAGTQPRQSETSSVRR